MTCQLYAISRGDLIIALDAMQKEEAETVMSELRLESEHVEDALSGGRAASLRNRCAARCALSEV